MRGCIRTPAPELTPRNISTVQVSPLYVSIGAGCVMCAYVCGLKLATYPDIVYVARTACSAAPALAAGAQTRSTATLPPAREVFCTSDSC